MIVRIVRMNFKPESVRDFLNLFSEIQDKIRSFNGCQHLELLKDVNDPNIFCTYSIWKSENDLNHYRFSELFKTTWTKTKAMFADKAIAYSLEKIDL